VRRIFLIVGVLISIGGANAAPRAKSVAAQGETRLAAMVGKTKVTVEIETHEIQIGQPGDKRPAINRSTCSYSRYPCSLVDHLTIAINDLQLDVPQSAFCGLSDLNKAEIKPEKKGSVLILYGGDASESYVVKIEFDATGVKRRALFSGLSAEQPLEETVYHSVIIGD
jgi:hypothetical protein